MGNNSGGGSKSPLKRRIPKLSYISVALCAVLAVGSHVFASYGFAQEKQADVPVLAANSWIGDLRAFHTANGAFPSTLTELEDKLWRPRRMGGKVDPNAPKTSVLDNPHVYAKNSYVYVYFRAENPHVASFWCVPVGENRTKANTVFVVLTPDAYEQWRGAALSEEMFQYIPRHAIPTQLEMSRLGMTKQETKTGAVATGGKKSGGLMGVLDSFFDAIFGS
jgi:hypothetical protein